MPYEYDERPASPRSDVATNTSQRARTGTRGSQGQRPSPAVRPPSGQDGGWRARLANAFSSGWNTTKDWVGETTDWAGEKISDGAEWVGETAGDIVEGTSELIDGVRNTDIDVGLERASATMRMEEIQEWLMPSGAANGLSLSEEDKEKTVTATYEYSTGMLTINTGALSITGAQFGQFRSGPAQLSGVVARLHNPSGGIPFFDDSWVQNASLTLNIGSVTGQNMHYGPAGAGLGAESVVLQQLEIVVTNVGSAMPLTGKAGGSTARFSVGSMALRGAYGAGTEVGSFNADGTRVEVNEKDGTASVDVESLAAGDIVGPNETTLTSGSATGLHVGVNGGQTTVTAENAAIGGMAVGDLAELGSAQANGLSLAYDHNSEGLSASSDALSIGGLRADTTTIDSATAEAVQLELGANPLENLAMSSSMRSLDVRGLQVEDDFSAARLQGGDVSVDALNGILDIGASSTSLTDMGLKRGSAGSMDATDLRVGVNTNTSYTTVNSGTMNLGDIVVDDASVASVRSSGVTAGIDALGGSFEVDANRLDLNSLQTPDGAVGSAYANTLSFQHNDRERHSSVSADSLGLQSISSQHGNIGEVQISQLDATSAEVNGVRSTGVQAASVFGADLTNGNASAETARLGATRIDSSGNDLRAIVSSGEVVGVTSQYGTVESGRVDDLVVDKNDAGYGAQLSSIEALGINSEYGSASKAGADGLTFRAEADAQSLQIDGMSATNLSSSHGSAAAVNGSGLSLSQDHSGLNAQLTSLTATDLASGNASATSASVEGIGVRQSNETGETVLNLSSAEAAGLQAGDVSIATANANGLQVGHKDGSTAASLDNATFQQLTGPYGTTIDQGRVDGLSAHHGPDLMSAHADRAMLESIGVNTHGANASIAYVDLNGVQGSLKGRELEASLENGVAAGMVGEFNNVEGIGIPNSGVPYIDMSQHNLDARLDLGAGNVRLGAGNVATVRDVANLVESADINATVPMQPGELGGMATIRDNTTLTAGVQVRDGRIVADQTGVQSSVPIDGPAWTTVNGAYLRDKKQGGQVVADVGGFIDQNVTGHITEGLTDDKSKHIPLEVGPLAERLTQGKDTGPATGNVVLGQEAGSDNQVRLQSNANGLAAALTRLLVSSLQLKTPNGDVEAGRTAVTDATITTSGTPNMPSTVNGSVGQVEIQSLSTRQTLNDD